MLLKLIRKVLHFAIRLLSVALLRSFRIKSAFGGFGCAKL